MLDCLLEMQPGVDLHPSVRRAAAPAVGFSPVLFFFPLYLLESFHRPNLIGLISSPPAEPNVPSSNIDFAHAGFNSLSLTDV